jgi:hypothetical protein
MRLVRGNLLLSFAVIPALLVTGASLVALVSGDAKAATTSQPGVSLNAAVHTTLTHTPAERAGLETLLVQPVASAAQQLQTLRSERLPRQQVQPAPAASRHTAIVPPVAPQPTVVQPQPPNDSNDDRGNSGSSGSGRDGEDDDGDHHGGEDGEDGEDDDDDHHGGEDGEDGDDDDD